MTSNNTQESLKKLSLVIIGSDDLSGKITGLARRKVFFLINCSTNDLTNINVSENQGFKVIKISLEHDDGHLMLSDQDVSDIKDMFETISDRKKILLHSESGAKSRIIYCLIAMKVLGIRLDQLISMFEERQQTLTSLNTQDMLDRENYEALTETELNILHTAECQIFGSNTYVLRSVSEPNVRTNNLTNQPSIVPQQGSTNVIPTESNTSSASNSDTARMTEELLMKLYEEDFQRMENEKLLDTLAAETAAEITAAEIINTDVNTNDEYVRPPIPSQTMVLMDTFGPDPMIPNQRTDSLSLQMMNHGPTPGLAHYSQPHSHQRSHDLPRTVNESRTNTKLKVRYVQDHTFEDYMATFGNNGNSQGTQVIHVQKKPTDKNPGRIQSITFPSPSYVRPSAQSTNSRFTAFAGPGYVSGSLPRGSGNSSSNSGANTQNPFDVSNPKDAAYKRIMSIMAGTVNPDLVRDLLSAGMSEDAVINTLTIGNM